jgi:hypothetical protein
MRDLTEWLLRIDWSNSVAVKKPTPEWFEDPSKVFLRVPYHPPITGPFKHWWGREKGRPHPNLYCCGAGALDRRESSTRRGKLRAQNRPHRIRLHLKRKQRIRAAYACLSTRALSISESLWLSSSSAITILLAQPRQKRLRALFARESGKHGLVLLFPEGLFIRYTSTIGGRKVSQ